MHQRYVLLTFKEADLGVGGFTVTYERRRAVDFLKSLWEEPVTYLMSKQQSSAFNSNFKPISVTNYIYISHSVNKFPCGFNNA